MTAGVRPIVFAAIAARHPGARLEAMAGDASTRSFCRLSLPDGSTRVVMDYGEPFTAPTDDERMTAIFREAGLPVADILDRVPKLGILILEDLGETTLETALASGGDRAALYDRAVDLAVAIALRGTPVLARSERSTSPALDTERLRFEMDFFVEHYVGGVLQRPAPPSIRKSLYALADRAASSPGKVLCHRDFHSRNIMVRPDGSVAMVDIQDARVGPDTYDVASLLYDCYVDLPRDEVARLRDRFVRGLPDVPTGEFETVALQRMIKALGTFGYQATCRGKREYLDAVPRTAARVREICREDDRFREILALFPEN